MEKIRFIVEETGEAVEFFVLEQTKLGSETYLLVTDSAEGDAQCLILRETDSKREENKLQSEIFKSAYPSEDADELYEIVEDDTELEAVSRLFEELLEDVDIEL